jgi:hypothetical protein
MSSSIAISFFLIGQSRSDISTPRANDLGHPQQLGADRQVRALHCLEIDPESDVSPVSDQLDHSAALSKAAGITHREDRPVAESREDLLQPARLGPADEQDIAAGDVLA